ncbi:NADH:flavin oxidoreductase/NADH oxidase [Vampirovibrio chlorellavorus]|uniref:NADH:flavin oxidoreductase/NADH oxidase n=1 Tax=Vampirovibrio chlorellavorus TaxID=758823 RepID=UPI0026F19488|nr:NADH:flavin oxidoreductase/NADH oxidase [Vampirovibrio chlorellavorus]
MSLFSPFQLREVVFRNRVGISPMCQYSCQDGFATDWHLVHLGSRAVGGAGMVMVEATAVSPEGRISPQDLGLWKDAHIEPLARVARFIQEQGAVAAIQIAHAGRKASAAAPWNGGQPVGIAEGGWSPVLAPSAIPFDEASQTPHALTVSEIEVLKAAFAAAARRALKAGFQVLELHAAHGYLLHSFLSPLSNQRTDAYGGSLENRMRLLLEIATEARQIWPESLPLWVRISASDWADGGWDVDQSVQLCRELKKRGVDLIDVSSGGAVPDAKIQTGPGYQVPFAEAIRQQAEIPTAAVGMITEAEQANAIIEQGQANLVLLGRESLRNPYWPLHAAHQLGVAQAWPPQYERGKPRIRQSV